MKDLIDLKKIKFDFQGKQVRTAINQNTNEIYFILKDICDILELKNITMVKSRLKQEGLSSIEVGVKTGIKTNGEDAIQKQNMILINEPNLYRCILQSRKKEAIDFQDWIVEDVLPKIRKTGKYETQQLTQKEQTLLLAKQLIQTEEENKQFLIDNEKKQEIITNYIRIKEDKNYTQTAKLLHLKPTVFINYLKDNKYIRLDRMPYQKYINSGYFIIKFNNKYESYLITSKGFDYFFKKFKI